MYQTNRFVNTAQTMMTTSRLLSNAASFGMCASSLMDTGFAMYDKYHIQGKEFDGDTKWEIASLALSLFGCGISGRGMAKSTKELGNMLGDKGFMDALKLEKAQYGCAIKSSIKGGNYCFVAGTLVHTLAGTENIEDIQVGDYVLAYDEESGETGYKKVVHLFRNTTEELAHIIVADTEEIVCTPGHTFYVNGKWVAAGNLVAGDILTLADGTTTEVLVVTVEQLETPIPIYNFEVEDWHTYYVADSGVLVHNMCVVNTTNVVNTGTGGSKTTTPGFDAWLNKGDSDNKVYFGIKGDEAKYTGITHQSKDARLYQHNSAGKGFDDLEIQYEGLTRNQARAIEQYFIENGPNGLNKINSIGINHRYYQDAINWAKQYLEIKE